MKNPEIERLQKELENIEQIQDIRAKCNQLDIQIEEMKSKVLQKAKAQA